jgi:DNA-binding transcriptional LysR family regulator
MPADLAIDHLTPILADFAKAYPLIVFEFYLTPRRTDLQTEPFELALRIGPPPTAPSMLVTRQIALLQRYLYAAPSYLKDASPINNPNDLINHVLCIAHGMLKQGRCVKNALSRRRDRRGDDAHSFAMSSVELSRSLATHGVGIAVLDTALV